ncbi:unnamed protein product [Oikopleura dioica]|uniref:Phospholipase A2-like central domain-containing protein n=1 Tax=Oikopleura dioica TaxID=34765 RepID=E4WUF4_OIKDI|nr:unnamed protein product [Oikopleura dioica]
MKISAASIIAFSTAKTVRVNDIQRNFGGNFYDNLIGAQERGYNYGNEDALRGLSAMAVFLDESRIMSRSVDNFEMEIQDFLDQFTNYGCYCWIVGPMRGVIGGGQTVDEIDNLCGQLYKCYKCLNLDHGSSPNLFEYSVHFNVNEIGERTLDCQAGPNVDACKCDVMFAEKLAGVNTQCEADMLAGETDSKFCVNEKYRTLNGGGPFDPTDNSDEGCLKINMDGHNAKDQCCGQYPDRLPFDSMSRECCEFTESDGDDVFFTKKIVPFGTCDARGGTLANED